MTAYVGPPEVPHVGALRSIARSIEPAFPTAAEDLRAIAADLEKAHSTGRGAQ